MAFHWPINLQVGAVPLGPTTVHASAAGPLMLIILSIYLFVLLMWDHGHSTAHYMGKTLKSSFNVTVCSSHFEVLRQHLVHLTASPNSNSLIFNRDMIQRLQYWEESWVVPNWLFSNSIHYKTSTYKSYKVLLKLWCLLWDCKLQNHITLIQNSNSLTCWNASELWQLVEFICDWHFIKWFHGAIYAVNFCISFSISLMSNMCPGWASY